MTITEAARILEVAPEATPEELEAKFLEARRKLEDKIAKAPTPGLQAKYRSALNDLTIAFETLTLAADASSLPVLAADSSSPPATESEEARISVGGPASAPASPNPSGLRSQVSGVPAKRSKSGGKEFAVVALVAVLLLGAGGWFVMKTRAENEEKARVAAAQKAEADRLAEQTRLAEVARLKKEEEDKIAERERLDRLTADLRSQLAEARLTWESLEKEERNTERAAQELKSDLRSATGGTANELRARLAAMQRYQEWLTPYLEKHPSRFLRAKVDELLSARLPLDAQPVLEQLKISLAELAREVPANKKKLLSVEGSVAVQSDPKGLSFGVVDAFGRAYTGTTPATLDGVAPGKATVTFKRPGFADVTQEVTIATGSKVTASASVVSQQVTLKAEPEVNFWVNDKFVGQGTVTVKDLTPGTHKLQFARPKTNAFPTTFTVKQAAGGIALNYSYDAVVREDQTCSPCSGRGNFTHNERCTTCSGRGTVRCMSCEGRGANFLKMFADQPAIRIGCSSCGQSGKVQCDSCSGRGQFTRTNTCTSCSGDGRVSQLQLATR